ncbi:MAG TPA: hypothetical protein VE631_07450, partial [Alphaproteobacteria bacterium]|nr:hypothetical protein [Alphaproteobacteria bacterium]
LTLYLRVLQAPSILFCWGVWAIFGQASGAYVSPKTWTVLYLACAVAIMHQRQATRLPALPGAQPARRPWHAQPAGWHYR